MREIKTNASNSGDFNFLFVLIIAGTNLLYQIGKEILDNNYDYDMHGVMMIWMKMGLRPYLNIN